LSPEFYLSITTLNAAAGGAPLESSDDKIRSRPRRLDVASANRDANPELLRLALKLATGAGKTTVMAMLIAWQTTMRCGARRAGISHAASWSARRA